MIYIFILKKLISSLTKIQKYQ